MDRINRVENVYLGADTTEEKYWDDIYELEKLRREQKEEEE